MNVSGVGTAAGMVLTAPAPTDRAPSEAARDAATTQITQTTRTMQEDKDKDTTTRPENEQKDKRPETEPRQEKPAERPPPVEGLTMPEMFMILGMHPVSPREAARLEAAKAQTETVARDGSFDVYA